MFALHFRPIQLSTSSSHFRHVIHSRKRPISPTNERAHDQQQQRQRQAKAKRLLLVGKLLYCWLALAGSIGPRLSVLVSICGATLCGCRPTDRAARLVARSEIKPRKGELNETIIIIIMLLMVQLGEAMRKLSEYQFIQISPPSRVGRRRYASDTARRMLEALKSSHSL